MNKEKQCPPGIHTDVPIIEGDQTVGLICTTCGRSVREDMAISDLIIDERGALVGRTACLPSFWRVCLSARQRQRKDPRF
jgi:hypothetical protein